VVLAMPLALGANDMNMTACGPEAAYLLILLVDVKEAVMKRLQCVVVLLVAIAIVFSHGAGLVSGQDMSPPPIVESAELPSGRPVSMSPDGTMVVSVDRGEQICVYLVPSMDQVTCASLAEVRVPVRLADVVWSPDSTRIAFAQDGFRLFYDSDIWMLEVESGQLTRLTDEASNEELFPGEAGTEFYLDVAPTWTPDSQAITFSRSFWIDGEAAGNVIAEVPAEGGDTVTLATIDEGRVGVWWSPGGWSPDGNVLYYSADPVPVAPLEAGIWAFDRATGETRQIAQTDDPSLGSLMLRTVSPSGDRLLAYYARAIDPNTMDASVQRFVDPATGEISDIPNPVPESGIWEGSWFSTFSPNGQYLLQPWGPPEAFDFWATDLTTGESLEVASDLPFASPIEIELSPVWASNGLVGVPQEARGFAFFPIDGIGLSATPPAATPDTGASPIASSAGNDFAPGDAVVAIGIAPLYAAPDPSATVVLVLTPGAEMQILGAPVENDFSRWYPVLDPATQTIGYVEAGRVGTSA
jgi:hypothetical protein